jgi:hypothetical protein
MNLKNLHVIGFVVFNASPDMWIINQAYNMIDKRREIGQTNRIDLMQLMLESASKEDFIQV